MNQNSTFLPASKITRQYAISASTLRRWADDAKIGFFQLPSGKHYYNLVDLQGLIGASQPQKAKIIYARVSSQHQRPDLDRQVTDLQQRFPGHELLTDIGSGLNYNRPNFKTLLERVYRGDVQEVCVAHKDRLVRYGSELLEFLFQKSNCKLVVLDQSSQDPDAKLELADDLLSVVNFFVARNNGRASSNRKLRKAAQDQQAKRQRTKEAPSRADEENQASADDRAASLAQ